MNIYEASKIVLAEHQYKMIRAKKDSASHELDCKDVLDHKGNKRGWTILDATTASVIVRVTEAINETSREKFLKLHPVIAINIAWDMVSS